MECHVFKLMISLHAVKVRVPVCIDGECSRRQHIYDIILHSIIPHAWCLPLTHVHYNYIIIP